MKFDFDN